MSEVLYAAFYFYTSNEKTDSEESVFSSIRRGTIIQMIDQ